jgi:hypothetical protein
MSLIDGSYEYYHYLHDGIDDNVMFIFYLYLHTSCSHCLLHIVRSLNSRFGYMPGRGRYIVLCTSSYGSE